MQAYVGQFAKTTSGAPASQTVTGIVDNLGAAFTPKVLIMWTEGLTSNNSFGTKIMSAIGFATGASNAHSMAFTSGDNLATSDTNRRIANKALTIVNFSATLVAECDFTSFGSGQFTLNWTTNDANATLINFMVLGGSDIVNATTKVWQMPTSTGNNAQTGAGFQPNFAFHMGLGAISNAPDITSSQIRQHFGAMTSSAQFSIHELDQDNQATTNTRRRQFTDAALSDANTTGSIIAKGSYVSFDSDGHTVNFTTAPATANYVFTLWLNCTNVSIGAFNKATGGAPASQSVSGLGYKPSAYMLFSYQNITSTASVTRAAWGIGGSDGTNEVSGAVQSEDNAADSSVDRITSNTKIFIKVNNNTPAVDAEADHSTMDSGGMTFSWSTNDAVATEINYIAFGPAEVAATTGRNFLTMMGVGS